MNDGRQEDIAHQRLKAQLIVGGSMALFFSSTALIVGVAFAPEGVKSAVTGVIKSIADNLRSSADNIQR